MAELLNTQWRNGSSNRDLKAKLSRVIYDGDASARVSTTASCRRDRALLQLRTD